MRPLLQTLAPLLLGPLGGLLTPGAHAQDYFDVPTLYTRSPEVFRAMFERARCETVSGIIMGDSQETSPGGAGAIYIPRFQFEFWDRYANAPQTPLAPMAASYGTAPVYADWLLRVANPVPGMSPSRLPAASLPPGMSAGSTSTLDGSNANGQWYPQVVMLQHDAWDVHPYTGLRGKPYFQLNDQVYLDVFAATNPSSGELRVQASYAPTSTPLYSAPPLAEYVTSMDLESPVAAIKSQRLGPLPYSPTGYLQVSLSGTDPTKLTDVIGARFVNTRNPRGWVFTGLAAGGYTIEDALNHHADSGPVIGALDPDVLVISFGANDCGRGVTAEQFEAWLVIFINFVRQSTRADLPVIILTDPYRRGLNDQQAAQYDRYPRAAYNVALEDPLVCSVNSRRLTEAAGWTAGFWIPFMWDNVHYSTAGAFLKSRLEAKTLFDAFLPEPPCKIPTREVPCGSVDPCHRPKNYFSMPE